MTFQNDQERGRRRKTDNDDDGARTSPGSSKKKQRQPAEVGDALRTVYQTTINEDIPPEMLELLGKLG